MEHFPLFTADKIMAGPGFVPSNLGCNWTDSPGITKKDVTSENAGSKFTTDLFSDALRNAGLLVPHALGISGSLAITPYGLKIFNLYFKAFRNCFEAYGIEEWDMPDMTSMETMMPAAELLDLSNKLLYVNDSKGQCGVLNPTGEEMIYAFWSKYLNLEKQFPAKVFRKATYFRKPGRGKHSGQTIFKSAESRDIFEFHCSYLDYSQMQGDLKAFPRMLKTLASTIGMGLFFSIRPPWTNNSKVSEWTLGGDFLLPTGTSVQVMAMYNQAQFFSKMYNIGIRKNNQFFYANQITGFVSRRIILAKWFSGLREDGTIFQDPDFAPVQVAVITRKGGMSPFYTGLQSLFKETDIRGAFYEAETTKSTHAAFRKKICEGVPVIIISFEPKYEGDPHKIILYRNDVMKETTLLDVAPGKLHSLVKSLLKEIKAFGKAKSDAYWRNSFLFVDNKDEVKKESGKILFYPLAFSKEAVFLAEQQINGEVLGFLRAEKPAKCLVTGALTDFIASHSRRL